MDTSYCKFGSETLLKLLKVFEDQIEGIVNNEEDIEYVHKTRVSSRRLRAALPLFRPCFPRKKIQKMVYPNKESYPTSRECKRSRCSNNIYRKIHKKTKIQNQKASVEMLLEDHKNLRKSAQPSIVSELKKLKTSDILNDMSRFCEQIISEQSNVTFDPDQVLGKSPLAHII